MSPRNFLSDEIVNRTAAVGFDSTSIDFIAGTMGGESNSTYLRITILGINTTFRFGGSHCGTSLWYRFLFCVDIRYRHSPSNMAVKVRFQTPELRQKYSSTFHALSKIIKEEKFVGLYKGITSPLVFDNCYWSGPLIWRSFVQQASCALLNGLIFASYRFFLRIQLDVADQPSLAQVTLAGIATGIVTS